MVKHIQTIRRQKPTNCLSVFDHFVGLALKGLIFCLRPGLELKGLKNPVFLVTSSEEDLGLLQHPRWSALL